MLKLHYCENDVNTANLYLHSSRVAKVSPLTPTVVSITGQFEPERQRVERFIQDIYSKNYGADITITYPVLMSVRNADDQILSAVGLRYAGEEKLFLEQYTGKPIEKILGCERRKIAEIGNLASAGQGASVFLFAALASYLHHKGISYAVVTGTDFLHRYFEKMGLSPHMICNAQLSDLHEKGQDWGTYYDTQPRVLAGSVPTGVKRLKTALGAKFEDCRPKLYSRIHCKTGWTR